MRRSNGNSDVTKRTGYLTCSLYCPFIPPPSFDNLAQLRQNLFKNDVLWILQFQNIIKIQYVTIFIFWYENCFKFIQVGPV